MSSAVTIVIDPGDGPAESEWLGRVRARFADITDVLPVSGEDSRPGVVHPAAAAEAPALARAEYVWFLPPGSEPETDSLPHLIAALKSAPALGAVGPKLITDDGGTRTLVAAGVTTTAEGLRVNAVAPGETDEGQYDRAQDVLAVDVPGLLVPVEVVRTLGGPSPVLAPAYRGIEYCRRIRAAGYRVELAPGARVRVPSVLPYRSSARPLVSPAQLRDEHRYRLANAPRSRAWWTALRLGVWALLAALGCLLSNDPRRAGWQLRGLAALPADLRATARLRRTRGGQDDAPALFASRRSLQIARRDLREDPGPGTEAPGRPTPTLDTSGEMDRFSGLQVRSRRSFLLHPLTPVLVATALASAVMFHSLLGPGVVRGGALPRLDVRPGELVDRILSPILRAGLGETAPADPLLTVLALASLLFLGDLDLLIRVLWFTAIPAAALIMYLCAGRIAPPTGTRTVLALVWACSPALLLSLAEGRVGTVVAWLCAPPACWALDRAIRLRRSTAAAGAGLAIAVVLAGSPFLVLPVTAGLLVLVAVLKRPGLMWTLLPTLGLFAAWLPGAVRHLDVFLTAPGHVLDYAAPTAYQLALGYPARPQSALLDSAVPDALTPWLLLLLMVPLVLAAALALLRVDASLGLLLLSVVLYCAGLTGGIVQAALEAGLTPERLVASYPGDSLLLVGLGAVGFTACALWPPGSQPGARVRALGLRILVPATALSLLGLFTAQALTAGLLVTRSTEPVLPVFATERSTGPLAQRTLLLDAQDGQLYGQLADARTGTVLATATLHEAARITGGPLTRRPAPLDAADTALATTIGHLTAGDGSDARSGLRDLGVGFVLAAHDAHESLGRDLAVSTGLTRLGESARGHLWQVETDGAPISYAQLLAPDGTASAIEIHDGRFTVPPGPDDRMLVLAERAGLTDVEIAGTRAPRVDAGWRGAVAVPATGGAGRLDDRDPVHTSLVVGGLGLLGLAVLTAVPFGRTPGPVRSAGSYAMRPPSHPAMPARRPDAEFEAPNPEAPSPEAPSSEPAAQRPLQAQSSGGLQR